jgi:transglutaminase-like putative cysteine protease
MYLAESVVKKKLETGNWDDVVFTKVNRYIKDIHSISYIKLRGNLEQSPASTREDLNVPGQKFTGLIKENIVEGIFEISYKKYDGKNAPSFPLNTDRYKDIGEWLKADGRIESDDHILIAKARVITDGSEDLWEASRRISQWVIDNIDGSIMGGTARETFDRRNGACGSQSILMAALCRSAGIPARVVWGCMYTHVMGGSFGQHAWNEIFMGDAGWIPVDVTFHEVDYVDSGHLRLGVLHTQQTIINFKKLEILEFEVSN